MRRGRRRRLTQLLTCNPYATSWLSADLLALNAVDEQLADAALAALDDIAHHRQCGTLLSKRTLTGAPVRWEHVGCHRARRGWYCWMRLAHVRSGICGVVDHNLWAMVVFGDCHRDSNGHGASTDPVAGAGDRGEPSQGVGVQLRYLVEEVARLVERTDRDAFVEPVVMVVTGAEESATQAVGGDSP